MPKFKVVVTQKIVYSITLEINADTAAEAKTQAYARAFYSDRAPDLEEWDSEGGECAVKSVEELSDDKAPR